MIWTKVLRSGVAILAVLSLTGCLFVAYDRTAGEVQPDRIAPTATVGPVNLDEDPHLVGWWKLDETAGKTAADASGKGHNGTLTDDLTFDKNSTDGRSGRALKVEGGHIEVAGFKGVLGTNPRTIAAWVKTDRGGGMIMSWGENQPGRQWNFRVMSTGIWADPRGGYLYTNEKVHDNEWHHVAVVVRSAGDGAPTLHDHVTLYRDGVESEIHDIGLLHMYPIETASGEDVTIGRGFQGLLDDVRLYDRALSDDEIAALAALKNMVD